jgi:predicted enzyme related to lactoylglutathione lyase
MDMTIQLILLPVADVDRAKAFYADKAGFRLDHDHAPNEHFRVVQLTPPGSACSVGFGVGLGTAQPGSVKGTHLVVADIQAARAELIGRGVSVSEANEMGPGMWFAHFDDPDGNSWVLQQIGG